MLECKRCAKPLLANNGYFKNADQNTKGGKYIKPVIHSYCKLCESLRQSIRFAKNRLNKLNLEWQLKVEDYNG